MRWLGDILVVVGGSALVAGMWQIYPPMCLMVGGILLLLAGLFSEWSNRWKEPKP